MANEQPDVPEHSLKEAADFYRLVKKGLEQIAQRS
jgi:hypothetical protein